MRKYFVRHKERHLKESHEMRVIIFVFREKKNVFERHLCFVVFN